MSKTYMKWWHSRFIDEINRDTTTISNIVDKARKTIECLEKIKILEAQGKKRIKLTGHINPFYIELLEDSIENELKNNPLVETAC